VILAGFFKGVDRFTPIDVVCHFEHAGAHGNFIIGEFTGGEGVGVDPLATDLIAFEVVAFEVAFWTGAMSGEGEVDGCVVILQIGNGVIDDFATFATNEQALVANV